MGRKRLTDHDDVIKQMASTSTLQEMANATGISRDAVRRSLKAQGLPFKQSLTTKGASKLDPHLDEIRKLYAEGCTATFLTEKFNCDWTTLRKFMSANGIEARKSWSRNPKGKALVTAPDETVQVMVQRYTTQDKTLKDISVEFGVCMVSVRKLLRNAGVTLRPAHSRPKSADEKLTTALKRGYGIDAAHYYRVLEAQQHRCAICGCEATDQERNKGKKRFNVDHNHETGQVRGLLCSTCNLAMGYFKDSAALLHKAAAYLESYTATPCLPLVSDEATSTSPKE
jgi:transposase